ncbi:ribonuclease III [Bifidobacterium sp. 82T24]|uniref:ribonuclease III n=1 Tax=Bifidobacterium pluvialisilvae TaxID=2834436 RepID=UPI001C58C76D|nr:ribonuclease III [Bifidobacterium pluvialisilvae]MBW3087504.1 ribonuclease III [Bifidobacterium pluvialisilvae]
MTKKNAAHIDKNAARTTGLDTDAAIKSDTVAYDTTSDYRPGDATARLLNAIGATISPDLLIRALTHRSYAHEHEGMPHYERLEFLGDAVLELVTTETLFFNHPDFSEGQMARIRAKTVSEESLAEIARTKLHLGPYLLLGRGEADDNGADKDSILCDVVESLIGAVFVEHGIDVARTVVHGLIDGELAKYTQAGPALDWKTSLTVKAHKMGLPEPVYRMEVGGPEYRLEFTAHVLLGDGGRELASATGSSKRKAQLAAAERAWHVLDEKPAKAHAK